MIVTPTPGTAQTAAHRVSVFLRKSAKLISGVRTVTLSHLHNDAPERLLNLCPILFLGAFKHCYLSSNNYTGKLCF